LVLIDHSDEGGNRNATRHSVAGMVVCGCQRVLRIGHFGIASAGTLIWIRFAVGIALEFAREALFK
jgi:hypothetical protein